MIERRTQDSEARLKPPVRLRIAASSRLTKCGTGSAPAQLRPRVPSMAPTDQHSCTRRKKARNRQNLWLDLDLLGRQDDTTITSVGLNFRHRNSGKKPDEFIENR